MSRAWEGRTWPDRLTPNWRSVDQARREKSEIHEIHEALRSVGADAATESVAKHFNVTVGEMLGRSRLTVPVSARHTLWAVVRASSPKRWSYPRLAMLFLRDHSSIMYGVKSVPPKVVAMFAELITSKHDSELLT